jgi:hypothetical protein
VVAGASVRVYLDVWPRVMDLTFVLVAAVVLAVVVAVLWNSGIGSAGVLHNKKREDDRFSPTPQYAGGHAAYPDNDGVRRRGTAGVVA